MGNVYGNICFHKRKFADPLHIFWQNSFDKDLPSNGNLASNVALRTFGHIFKVVNAPTTLSRECGAFCFMYNNHPTTPCHFYVIDPTTRECFLGSGDYTSGTISPSNSPLDFGMNKSKQSAVQTIYWYNLKYKPPGMHHNS